MKPAFALAAGKIPALVLACLLLAACSTTQKGSTGTGTQEAAPISEAGQAQPATGDAASPEVRSAAPAAGTSSTDVGSAAQPGAAAPGKGDEEAARLQKQLADQEAEINRLRDEQIRAQQLADEEAARQRAAQESEAAAAATPVPGVQAGGGSPAAPEGAPDAAAAGTGGATASQGSPATSGQATEQPAAQPLARSIYFEFDNATIADEYDSVILAHAAFLKANPDFTAEVQGNCDERGSREYNIALGARRAEAVKRGLELAGADGRKIKTVSFGAEKPVAFGQDEDSYRQNRRADIVY